tara:strand:- start:329 stop:508 length:180 start_codon:yes stop_codon:yes gene_type:complete
MSSKTDKTLFRYLGTALLILIIAGLLFGVRETFRSCGNQLEEDFSSCSTCGTCADAKEE